MKKNTLVVSSLVAVLVFSNLGYAIEQDRDNSCPYHLVGPAGEWFCCLSDELPSRCRERLRAELQAEAIGEEAPQPSQLPMNEEVKEAASEPVDWVKYYSRDLFKSSKD